MQTNNEPAASDQNPEAESDNRSDVVDEVELSREATLQWLLDMNRDEPEEKVFVVANGKHTDFTLSAQEAAVAARPMIRGRADADDLMSYVEEEIVLGEGESNNSSAGDGAAETGDSEFEALMAVDFSRDLSSMEEGLLEVDEGSDILGLEDEDDIGEQYLVVKRVKRQTGPDPAQGAPGPETGSETAGDQPTDAAATGEEAAPPPEFPPAIQVAAQSTLEELTAVAPEAESAGAGGEPLESASELASITEAADSAPAGEDTPGLEVLDFTQQAPDETPTDYHEDLRDLVAEENAHAVVTPRIAGLMTEIEAALEARLAALGRPAGSVSAEVSIADSEVDREAVCAEGFEALDTVCTVAPEALEGLETRFASSIFLRLCDAASGELCNRLFHEDLPALDITVAAEDDAAGPGEKAAPGAPETAPPAAGLRLVETRIFEDDLLPEDGELESAFSGEAQAEDWEPDGEEIDAIFGDLGGNDPYDPGTDELPPLEDSSRAVEAAAPATASAPEDWSWAIPESIAFARCSPSGGEIFAEFLDAFIEEGSTELEKLEAAISAWEADITDSEKQLEVGRVLHTVKGIAKGVGLHYYGTLIHNFETLLEELPRPAADQSGAYFRIVNAWLDSAVRGLDHVQEQRKDIEHELPGAPPVVDDAPVGSAETSAAPAAGDEQGVSADEALPDTAVAEVEAPAKPQLSAEEVRRKEEDKKLADEGARALAAQQSVRITSEKLDLLLNLTNQAQQLGVRTAQSASRTKRATAELQGRLTSVRAHIADISNGVLLSGSRGPDQSSEALDALEMDRYSELQEAANILREGVEDLADLIELVSRHNSQSEALLKQQATVISSIGSSIRAARVVPVSRLTPGLRRLVRTVSADLGKEVAFRVVNEVGTLDRDDYARCQTILEHMVRNALDHGMESAEERHASGKPSVGQISLDLRKTGADTVIVLSDDGRGMDPAKIRATAKDKGIGGEVDTLSDEEALNLVFHKGFSTASEVSQISGRGVGMDIVASELRKMGGDIRISSEVGKGSAFHLRIPTNVAVNGALLVSAGENYYAIPLGGLISVDEVPVETFFDAVEQGELLEVSSMECEPAYLGTLCKSGNLPDRATWRRTIPVLIAGSDQRRMAIAVDDVEEALELVIRTLGAQFAAVPGVSGAATTADGEAVVALDLNVLVSSIGEGQGTAVAMEQPREEKLLALVVDDSRTQRMVATSQLESVGLETATAENGAVAIDWLNTTERLPDIVLMDVEMPVKDGIQALREIRKSPRFADIPVIMITSRTGVKHRTLAEEAGCNGYMGKPFNFRMLIGQINELTGHRLELEQQEQ